MDVLTVHPFHDSGFATWDLGKRICRCGCVQDHRLHELPPVADEVREAEARKLGESE